MHLCDPKHMVLCLLVLQVTAQQFCSSFHSLFQHTVKRKKKIKEKGWTMLRQIPQRFFPTKQNLSKMSFSKRCAGEQSLLLAFRADCLILTCVESFGVFRSCRSLFLWFYYCFIVVDHTYVCAWCTGARKSTLSIFRQRDDGANSIGMHKRRQIASH